MKFRTMLLASAAVMFTASAFATEITNPFYLPTQGKFLSSTSVQTSRFKLDDGANVEHGKDAYAVEELTVGVMDNLALVGSIGNTFDYGMNDDLNNDHNFDYKIGAKYNVNEGNVVSQFGLAYKTFDPRSWYGKSAEGEEYDTNRWSKALEASIKLGYVCDCGMTPYTSFTAESTFDRADRDQDYTWFLGAYKGFDKVSTNAGVLYKWGNGEESDQEWFAKADVDYHAADNFTVGVYGDYYLGGEGHHDVDYGYTVGLNAKVLF